MQCKSSISLPSGIFDSVSHSLGTHLRKQSQIEQFSHAVQTNNIKCMWDCIMQGTDPNTVIEEEESCALHFAIERNYAVMVETLLACKDTDVNRLNNHDYTPLHMACSSGKRRLVSMLLKNQADANLQDRIGKTALHMAVKIFAIDMALLLFKYNANPNIANLFGNTPLAISVLEMRSYPLTKLMLMNGAKINLATVDNMHVFLQCCMQCNSDNGLDLVKLLLEYGAEINIQDNIGKRTCLHLVAITDYEPLARLLLDKGADPKMTDIFHRTPYQMASQFGSYDVAYTIDAFLKRGPSTLTSMISK